MLVGPVFVEQVLALTVGFYRQMAGGGVPAGTDALA